MSPLSHAKLEPLDLLNIPPDADVIVLFLPKTTGPLATAASIKDLAATLSPEHHAARRVQSQNGFAQADLLQPAEDV